MVKIEISEKAATELINILAREEADIRGRRGTPKGMSAAQTWDRLDAIKEIGEAYDAIGFARPVVALIG